MSLAEDLTRSIDIVDYITKFIPLKKSGANWVGNCPFHKEKTPSFMVSDSKGIFKCFGCGKGGDVITFAMEYERLDFVDTLKYLAEYAHIDTNKYPKFTSDPAIKQTREQTKSLNQVACNHFIANLQENQSALEYLHKRNLNDQIIQTFQLGYAPEGYYDLINYLKKYGFTTEQILESGVCKTGPSGDMYDFFRKRIIIPIRDAIGNIIAFTGRVLDPQDSPKYLNITNTSLYDKSKTLYGMNFVKKHIGQYDMIIVVEGNMDVIALHRIDLPIGVATCGTSLTEDHIKTIKRHTDNVYFMFDNDDAGFSASVRALKIAYNQDLYPQVLQLGTGNGELGTIKDVDDFANAGGTAEQLMSTAVDGLSYIINQLKIKYNLTNPVDKKKVINTLFEIIKSINDLSITQHYLHDISKQLDISEAVLLSQYTVWYKQNRYANQQDKKEQQHTKVELDSTILVQALLADDSRKTYIQKPSELEDIIGFYKELSANYGTKSAADEQQTQLLYASSLLWRDHELSSLEEPKKIQFIKSMTNKLIEEQLKQIMKTSILSPEEKTAILEKRKHMQ